MSDLRELLHWAADQAADYRESLGDRAVQPSVDVEAVRKTLGDLEDHPASALEVLEQLVDVVTPALTATAGPRYFGFVTGGARDVATAADVLTTGWDQLAYNQLSSPAAAIAEEVVGTWLKDLLQL